MDFTELFLASIGFMLIVPWLLTGVLWTLWYLAWGD